VEYADVKQTLAGRFDPHRSAPGQVHTGLSGMISFDPDQQRLYLAAAAHLCAIWVKEQPETAIKNGLFQGKEDAMKRKPPACSGGCDRGRSWSNGGSPREILP